MYPETVIFSIDFSDDPVIYNMFVNYVHNHELRRDTMFPCIGTWKGVTERSFLMSKRDFELLVGDDWYHGQEAILHITGCNQAYGTLEYADGRTEYAGVMRCVPKEFALTSEAWTYRPDRDTYYVLDNSGYAQ